MRKLYLWCEDTREEAVINSRLGLQGKGWERWQWIEKASLIVDS